MLILVTFLLGVANFAVHRAVLDSGHPLMRQVPWFFHVMGGRFSLLVEFVMLLGAMLLVAGGSTGWAWFYTGYSVVNAMSAWLILTGRV
jgi:hypothetical protein